MLKINYLQDILNTAVNTVRKYTQTNNADGTVSFTDETDYLQMGDYAGMELMTELVQNMMGFVANNTVFNANGSITETGTNGVKVTTFNADGSITEVFTDSEEHSISKTTVFNANGSITETITTV